MYYILLSIILILLLMISYKLTNDFFNPVFMAIVCFLIGTVLCFFNIDNWNYQIGYKSFLAFSLFFAIIVICTFLADYAYRNGISHVLADIETNKVTDNVNVYKKNVLSNVFKYLIPILLFLMFVFILYDRYNLCINNGYKGSIFALNSLSVKWKEIFMNGAKLKHLSTYFRYLLKGFALVSLYGLIINKNKYKLLDYLYYLLLIIPCILDLYVNAWRGNYLYIASAIVAFYGFRISDKEYMKKNNFDIVRVPLLILVIVIVFWIFTIIVRENKTDINYIMRYLSVYFGAGIPLFDEFLNGIAGAEKSKYFGEFIFRNIYMILNRLGITNFEIRSIVSSQDVYVNTNVYTAFYRSYIDFGLIGTCVYFGIISFAYFLSYNILKNNNRLIIFRILYGYYLAPLLILASEDYFLQAIIGTEPFYMIVSIIISYYILRRIVDYEY